MAMNNELLAIVSFIERERGVDRETVQCAIEQALQQAARRNPGVTNDLRVLIDRKTLALHPALHKIGDKQNIQQRRKKGSQNGEPGRPPGKLCGY